MLPVLLLLASAQIPADRALPEQLPTRPLAGRSDHAHAHEFHGPDRRTRPLDRLVGQAPGALTNTPLDHWCPSGSAFVDWAKLRGLDAPRRRPGNRGRLAMVGVSLVDGIVVMEDDGTLTRHDRVFDLPGEGLEFTPNGAAFDVARRPVAYEPDVGTQVLVDAFDWADVRHDLTQFAFPFGGTNRTSLWITSTFTVAFQAPTGPSASQLLPNDVLLDRTPRVAPVQQGTSLLGWNAFVREHADRVVITWRANDGGRVDVDVQAVLHDDGRITFSYPLTSGLEHGSPAVITENASWWNDRGLAGSGTDPAGDVPVGPPDGGAVDLVELRAVQVGGSDLFVVEFELDQAPPAMPAGSLQYSVQLRDEAGDDPFHTTYAVWENGGWGWRSDPVEIVGNSVRVYLDRSELPLSDDDIELLAWTGHDWNWHDWIAVSATFPTTPSTPLVLDYSSVTTTTATGPVLEAFTLPELLPGAVYDVFQQTFDDPPIDGLAIYQNFLTDIIFYAGAYSTVGNPGADGIGVGSAADPIEPALLHMNALGWGWNAWDAGKVTVLNHEFGHHWLYFFSILENGTPTRNLNPASAHPAGWVHAPAARTLYTPEDASCMGGSTWVDHGNGSFTSAPNFVSYGYSWHELYLMGLADVSEVTDWYYIENPNPGLPRSYWPGADVTVSGTRVDVNVGQIIGAHGPRVPDFASSQRSFIVPMVLVVRPGQYTQAEIDDVVATCAVWAPAFEDATVDRGDLTCDRVGFRPPNCEITTPATVPIVTAGDRVSFIGFGTDPDWDDVQLTWSFDGQAPAANGTGPIDVTFDTVGTYTIVLDAVDSSGMADPTPATIDVEVRCRIPDPVDDLRVSHGGGRIAFTWQDLAPLPDRYVLVSSLDASAAFAELADTTNTGSTGMDRPLPTDQLVFYEVRARNLPNCDGP